MKLSVSRLSVLSLAVAAACASTQVRAQTAETEKFDAVTVTGTRVESESPVASTTLITREEIARLNPVSLQELLRGRAGVNIYNQGGAGKLSGLSMRGMGTSHYVFMIDGVKVGNVTSGLPMIHDIPVSQIERIEIVRGPMSSLYGSEAMSGVIQIFTRRAEDGFSPTVSVGLGTQDSQRLHAGFSGKQGKAWYALNGSYSHTGGFNACHGDPLTFQGCGTIEPDTDGYKNGAIALSGGYAFNDAWRAEANLMSVDAENFYDGWFNHSRVQQQTAGAKVRFSPSEKFALTASVGRNRDRARNFHDTVFMNDVNTQRDQAALQADIALAGTLSIGYDWSRDSVESSTKFTTLSRFSRAVFGQWMGDFGRNHVQLGLRHENNSQYGSINTGNAGWGFDISDALRIRANYGTAFRAPSFNDLYYPGSSNPDLKPERSKSMELGVEGRHGWGHWTLSAYENRLRDLIVFDPTKTSVASPWGQPDNVQIAKIRGVEAEVGTQLAGWDVNGSLTWLDPRNRTPGAQYGNLLNRRSRLTGRVDVDKTFGQFRVGASINGANARYDDPNNRVRLAGYATGDLRLAWLPTSDMTVQFTATNVLDKRYETSAWYNQAGRAWMLDFTWAPKQ
ncbi:TonB-dependent receptor domain-containing protein [Lysobacter soyae]|uniref:TonB-dependent receptor n=1 Tax=Lysobacter soyae TaxID=2764185 RepID=A0ABX8WQ25_9GAMM|nr:TonB-dependent receptor [Lysobacter sp. CJ11]QYR52643.1 TonB-dependent receptor [Lysobacter sp. CJ11]